MALSTPQVAIQALPLDTIINGDCLDVLRSLPDNSVDAIVTDPPSGIAFMGKAWDNFSGKKRKDGQSLKALAEADGKWLKGRGTLPYGFGGDSPSPKARQNFIDAMTLIFAECLRVLKPGGHALVWALPRTSHWTATAMEDAGFEIRDRVSHFFGSGFPKSLDVSKALDKQAGAKRAKIRPVAVPRGNRNGTNALGGSWQDDPWETTPATDAARDWDGWGTALKPSVEDWWLVRKPLSERNVAANVLRWGTGALNIAASRVGISEQLPKYTVGAHQGSGHSVNPYFTRANQQARADAGENPRYNAQGRWPSHLLLSHSIWCSDGGCDASCPIAALDAQSGIRTTGGAGVHRAGKQGYHGNVRDFTTDGYGDSGGASRYFQQFAYVPKASRSERNRGCDDLPLIPPETMTGRKPGSAGLVMEGGKANPYAGTTGAARTNSHPTVKPLALMTWLIRLITPAGGVVLDPFAGSGSTLVAARDGGWRYLGIEREAEYVAIAQARLAPPALPAFAVTAKKPRRKKVSA